MLRTVSECQQQALLLASRASIGTRTAAAFAAIPPPSLRTLGRLAPESYEVEEV
jgi:hypothetical protein